MIVCTSVMRVGALDLTGSGDIGVAATVFGPPPTMPAIITSPVTGTTFDIGTITVGGTCGPGLLVKILRNNLVAGSTICKPEGVFDLQVSLISGSNTLQARNYDFQDQAGPDSPDVIINYVPAVSEPPTSGSSQHPGRQPASQTELANLILTSSVAYKNVAPNSTISWPFDVSGGQPPYAALIDWGDGATLLISIKQAGRFTGQHAYSKPGTYRIIVKVTDENGAIAIFQSVAEVQGAQVLPALTGSLRFYDQVLPLLLAWPLYIFLTLLVLSFWLGEKYQLHLLKVWGVKKHLR